MLPKDAKNAIAQTIIQNQLTNDFFELEKQTIRGKMPTYPMSDPLKAQAPFPARFTMLLGNKRLITALSDIDPEEAYVKPSLTRPDNDANSPNGTS